jgi:hypothetical protein
MEAQIKRRLNTLERTTLLAKAHPVNLPRVTTLTSGLDTIILELRQHAGNQDHGHAAFRSGSAIRAQRAGELLELMRTVNRIVRALDPQEFPGLKEKFRMPRGDGYQRLLGRAAAFIEAAEPIRSEFIERGLDPDFVEQILARRDEMHAALAIKNNGLSQRVGSTAGLADLARRGMKLLRELDAILTHQYRHDADLLASWKSACHVERAPRPNQDPNDSPASLAPPPLNAAKVDDTKVLEPSAKTERVQSAPVLAFFTDHESPSPRHWRLHPVPNRLPHVPR